MPDRIDGMSEQNGARSDIKIRKEHKGQVVGIRTQDLPTFKPNSNWQPLDESMVAVRPRFEETRTEDEAWIRKTYCI